MVRLTFLTGSEIEAVHTASLKVLEKAGVKVNNGQALKLLMDNGCTVDGDVVHMPPSLVEESVKKAPASFNLYTREADETHTVGGDNVIYNPGSAAIFFTDRETGEMRRANARDFKELVRLTDALEHIHAQSTAMVPADVPDEISDLYRLYVILKNSSKPIVTGAFTKEGLIDMKNMLEAVAGDGLAEAPRAIFDCCPSSPLMWSDVTCQNLLDCAAYGIPAEIIPAPQMGATSPVTIAGTIVEANAEFLSGAVISQLAEPGSPIVYGGSPSVFDMRHCTARLGAVEAVMAACAFAEMGKHYGVPTHGYLGLSDSKAVDAQSSFESGMGILLAAMARVNVVSGPGMQASENCQSLEKLVIDNELCGAAYRLIDGIRVDEETLAAEIISKVGPGGHFLAEKHTRDHHMKERHMPSDVIDRLSPDAWTKAGSKDATRRAKEIADETLREHTPKPLPKDSEDRLETVFKAILKRHGIKANQLPTI
ncbi:trimethylamine methyltransferase family protein [Candidatus Bathyarchaeota archaeon]|nr:trimethylamine methyltransferase family protein [Candidatus Bathyarchaeota archaeon]